MLYRLVPTLIDAGKVYIAESPLFEITVKDKSYFAYTEKEKAEITAKLSGKNTPFSARKVLAKTSRK